MATLEDVTTVFTLAGWDEAPYAESGGVKLTKARFEKEYKGDIAGHSVTESLMVYTPDGNATFVGLERFEGEVRGQKGSFVIRSEGEFVNGVTQSRGTVVAGAGTGDLRKLTGEVPWKSGHAAEYPMTFRLNFG